MNQNFDICMTMLLAHEGGYSDDSRDSGGKTNLGVTKRVYDEFYGGDATEEVMKALSKGDVEPIYRRNYWERCRCQDLPSGVDWAVFDFAVNAGTGRAARTLQKAVEAEQDGSIGPLTLMLVDKQQPENVINRIAVYREEFYRSLSNFDVFGRGWLRRNDETRKQALALI